MDNKRRERKIVVMPRNSRWVKVLSSMIVLVGVVSVVVVVVLVLEAAAAAVG